MRPQHFQQPPMMMLSYHNLGNPIDMQAGINAVGNCFSFWGKFELNLYIICFRFMTNIISYVTGLAETKKCPQDLTFTKSRQNKLSHVAKK